MEIIPVLNKVDLPSANPEEVKDQIIDLIGCEDEDILMASAKTGLGIEAILSAIVKRIPSPEGNPDAPLQAMVFDSVFNPYRGIEVLFRVVNGTMKQGEKVKFMNSGSTYDADEIGALKLKQEPRKEIKAGNVGYLISGIKEAKEVQVGDTITTVERPADKAIAGFEKVKPMVFAGIFPVDTDEFEELRTSLEKLQLNDASLTFEPESSAALGFGFRCGFLGMLHMEIVQERLEREFKMTVITTVPNVSYHAYMKKDTETRLVVTTPSEFPDPTQLDHMDEPFINAQIITKSAYVGAVMNLSI